MDERTTRSWPSFRYEGNALCPAREYHDGAHLMGKRPTSGSKKPRSKLQRVDARRSLALAEFDRVTAWTDEILACSLAENQLSRDWFVTLLLHVRSLEPLLGGSSCGGVPLW